MPHRQSRYREVSRRTMLRGSLGTAALIAIPGLGCGTTDEDVFETGLSDTGSDASTTAEVTDTSTGSSTLSTTATIDSDESATTSGTEQAETGGLNGEMEVAFTYTMGEGGKRLNPYVAVWIENADGELLRTVALWYEQSRKGDKWLRDLKRWFTLDRARLSAGGADVVDVISSATRLPGSYAVTWDGLDETGAPVADTNVFVAIESHRERGPYSLIKVPYMLDGQPNTMPLPGEGELSEASVTVRV